MIPKRKLGKTGIEVGILGFGCMRLPTKNINGKDVVDKAAAIGIIRLGIDLGINYLDTAYVYHEGESEEVLGEALKQGYREKVYISTKLPLWKMESRNDFRPILEEQLGKLGTTIDFYHMHMLNREWFHSKVLGWNLMAEMEKARSEGLIKHFSFSFHDEPPALLEIIDSGLFETMLVQYNLLDRSLEEGIERAYEKGMGVLVMGPVGGGRLAKPLPSIRSILPPGHTMPGIALSFVFSNKMVSCALSGMGSEEMVRENCKTAENAGNLPPEILEKAETISRELGKVQAQFCTSCNYCMPCPNEVNIPMIFKIYTDLKLFGTEGSARFLYNSFGRFPFLKGKNAEACTMCGECLEKCPQKINIPEKLKEIHSLLAGGEK